MRFKERELSSHAEPLLAVDLKEGSVYFSVNYVDDTLLTPIIETLVFIGRDLEPGDSGQVYFQDIYSFQRGVRYGFATEQEYAQFSTGSAEEVSHLFEYEGALEELMRCSVRRQKLGGELIAHKTGDSKDEELSPSRSDERQVRALRFDDAKLQELFLAKLRKATVPFEVRSDGAVVCSGVNWSLLNGVAHTIRDSCFRWYFVTWKTLELSHMFRQELISAGLPFQVEHHDDKLVFLVSKEDRNLHRDLIEKVQEREGT